MASITEPDSKRVLISLRIGVNLSRSSLDWQMRQTIDGKNDRNMALL